MARAAQRIQARGWRDPRLVAGIIIVLATTLLGAKLFISQDHTDGYWSLASPVKAGETVRTADVVEVRARLTGDTKDSYVRSDHVSASELTSKVWTVDMSPGGLLPRTVLADSDHDDASQLPLAVDDGALPADLKRGDAVDIWVGPAQGETQSSEAEAVLREATVLSAGEPDALGSGTRTVLVAVDPDIAPSVISAIGSAHVTIVRVTL